jgi:hypothetical protein
LSREDSSKQKLMEKGKDIFVSGALKDLYLKTLFLE